MWTAFPSSDYYAGSVTRPACSDAGEPDELPKFTEVASSYRLRSCLYALLGRSSSEDAGQREYGIPALTGLLCSWKTETPMTPPSPYRKRVVTFTTLQAVPFVTVTILWLAVRGLAGWPPPHCREGFRHGPSGPHACFPGHRPTPGRVPHRERSTCALLGALQLECY